MLLTPAERAWLDVALAVEDAARLAVGVAVTVASWLRDDVGLIVGRCEGLPVGLVDCAWLDDFVVVGVPVPERVVAWDLDALGVVDSDAVCEYEPPGERACVGVTTWLGVKELLGV